MYTLSLIPVDSFHIYKMASLYVDCFVLIKFIAFLKTNNDYNYQFCGSQNYLWLGAKTHFCFCFLGTEKDQQAEKRIPSKAAINLMDSAQMNKELKKSMKSLFTKAN